MTTYVVDASVVIKWLVDEVGTDAALSLRDHNLLAPDLLMAECAKILWKKVRRQELLPAEAMLGARLLTRSDVALESARSLTEAPARLSLDLDHPAYDCVYSHLPSSAPANL